jgi:hypothetical protein
MDNRFEKLLNNFFHWKLNLEMPFREAFNDYHDREFFIDPICGEILSNKIEFQHIYSEFNTSSEYYEYPNIIYHHTEGDGPECFDVYHYPEIFKLLDRLQGSRYEY